jgi:hypothetical protein
LKNLRIASYLKHFSRKLKGKRKSRNVKVISLQALRYDNAKHHPEIKTFPHHKHISGKIEDSKEPELIDVLSE